MNGADRRHPLSPEASLALVVISADAVIDSDQLALPTSDHLVTRRYASITDALRQEAAISDDRRLIVVVQSWPDQYSLQAAERLIGTLLFSRLLCVYGPWCESDGRTRQTWPVALRVPLRMAAPAIRRELQELAAGAAPFPVTSSAEELFGRIIDTKVRPGAAGLTVQRAAAGALDGTAAMVISGDRALRAVFGEILEDLGCEVSLSALWTPESRRTATLRTAPLLVVHDLDPRDSRTDLSLTLAAQRFPASVLIGVSDRPDLPPAAPPVRFVIPKLDGLHAITAVVDALGIAGPGT